MTVAYLSVQDFAERVGITPGTLRSYIKKGLTPEPDAIVGLGDSGVRGVRGWLPETIDRWQAARPGRGARTDLHP